MENIKNEPIELFQSYEKARPKLEAIQENEPPKKKRKTYSQNWSVYTLCQEQEKLMVYKIINDVIDCLNFSQTYKGNGRPNVILKEIIKELIIKQFNGFSSRRNKSELILVKGLGYINKEYHFTTLCKYLRKEELTPILHLIYKALADPLKSLENYFSTDATGFSTFDKKRWVEIRLDLKEHKDYKKLHVVTGNLTNVITSVDVSEGTWHESPYFKILLKDTAKRFNVKEISADAGYLSRENCNTANKLGVMPYIMPKKNVSARSKGSATWHRMIRLWKNNESLFREHYHQRSNVESTFSMIKRKFGTYLRSKNDTAKFNEILLKVICHNACVLSEALLSYDIKIDF